MEALSTPLFCLAEISTSLSRPAAVLGSLLAVALMVVVPVMFVLSLIRYVSTRNGGWLAGLVISTLLLITGVTLFLAGAWNGFQKASQLAKTPHGVTTTDQAITLQIPGNWKDLPELLEEATLRKGNLIREEYLVTIPESKADYPGTLEDAATAGAARVLTAVTDPERSEPKELTLDGHRAIQYELTGNSGKHRVVYFQTTVETKDSFQHLLMWTLENKREAAVPIFNGVLESARLKKD